MNRPTLDEIAVITGRKDITRGYLPDDEWLYDREKDPFASLSRYNQIDQQILRDWSVKTCLEQRILAHTSCEVEIIPGGDSAKDKKAADFIKEQVSGIAWDQISQQMHMAVFWGRGNAEAIYAKDDRYTVLDDTREGIKVRDARRFRYNAKGELLLLTQDNWKGEVMPPNKFWRTTFGAASADNPNGEGLWWWLKHPCLFKRGGIKSWLQFLDKFAQPTVVGKYDGSAASDEDKKALRAAVAAFASATGVTIPQSTMIELIEASRSGTADYSQLNQVMDEAISKIVVGQTMTSSDGSSEAQAKVHLDVRQDLVKADADIICESANQSWVRWLCEWNFPDAKPPKIWRKVEQEEDLNARVNRDKTLFDMGFVIKTESLTNIYGDDYEEKPQEQPQDPLSGLSGILGQGDQQGEQNTPNGASALSPSPSPTGEGSFAEFIESLESQFAPVEFAQRQCKNGWPCGGTCISKTKSCGKKLAGQAATYAQWVQQQAGATGVTAGGNAPAGVAAQPKQTKAQLQAQAAQLGLKLPKSATKATIQAAIQQAAQQQQVGATPSAQIKINPAIDYNPYAIKDLSVDQFNNYLLDKERQKIHEDPDQPWNKTFNQYNAEDPIINTKSRYRSEITNAIGSGVAIDNSVLQNAGVKLNKTQQKQLATNLQAEKDRRQRIADIQKAIDEPLMTDAEIKGYKPQMTADEAAQYTKGSRLDGFSFYHGNSASVVDSVAQDGVIADRNNRGIFGKGFYLAVTQAEAENYAQSAGSTYPNQDVGLISAKLKVKNPYVVSAGDLQALGANFPGSQSNLVDAEAITNYLKAKGHDSIYMKDYGYFVAFDGRQVATYSVERISRDSDRYKGLKTKLTSDELVAEVASDLYGSNLIKGLEEN